MVDNNACEKLFRDVPSDRRVFVFHFLSAMHVVEEVDDDLDALRESSNPSDSRIQNRK